MKTLTASAWLATCSFVAIWAHTTDNIDGMLAAFVCLTLYVLGDLAFGKDDNLPTVYVMTNIDRAEPNDPDDNRFLV